MRETWLLDLMHWPGYNKVDSISTISYPVHCFADACANYIISAFQVLPSQETKYKCQNSIQIWKSYRIKLV